MCSFPSSSSALIVSLSFFEEGSDRLAVVGGVVAHALEGGTKG
jgi:hypothetical protein